MASSKVPAKLSRTPPGTAGGSVLKAIVPLVLLTVLAGGAGSALGLQIVALAKNSSLAGSKPAAAPADAAAAGDMAVTELHPIVTNLTAPQGTWVRLQASLVYDRKALPNADVVAAEIGDDLLAYLKTLSIAQVQGASGLQNLREDLNERAAIRSDGRVHELVIEALVVQ